MKLYHPTHHPYVPTEGTLMFHDAPLAGHGGWLLVAEVPRAERYRQRDNGLMIRGVGYFRLPASVLSSLEVQSVEFSAVTGASWDAWNILLRAAGPESDQSIPWSQVWASRSKVAECVLMQGDFQSGLSAHVELRGAFDPQHDYIIMETQRFGGREWHLELLAGAAPAWADFPNQWNSFVWSVEVQASAASYLGAAIPAVSSDVAYALTQREKVNKIRAWRIVAEKIGREVGRDLGKVPAGSWTSVAAMPIRIAQRLGGWEPPIPKPEFQNPDESGRVLIASPYPRDWRKFTRHDKQDPPSFPRREGQAVSEALAPR